ncbi:hypothetical protein [Leptolyngbya sp. BC1307]|uniref:hypothetical protein n=1 Tax=Leptolyngbya sp. BC1307 TaxID=2029589 RepID=UPI000EFCEEF9|nr:hypothetical protein [Leptolyngbya sp. BC1307]
MKNIIEYRGYLGKVGVDFDDGCIYASVANAEGLYLTAEGNTPVEVEAAFKSIIDDYLAGAQANGWVIIEPKTMATP